MDQNKKIAALQKLLFGTNVSNPVVWDLQKLIFVIILVLLLIKPTSSAIFLSTAGVENLPIVYILLALVAFVVSLWYNRLISSRNPLQLFQKTIATSVVALLIIGLVLFIPSLKLFASYIFYIFISIFGIFTASQFWILANQLFNAREARKYFGVIGFGAIAGGVLGGYLTSIITAVISSEWIPIIAAVTLSSTFYWITKIKSQLPDRFPLPKPENLTKLREPIQMILDSKHLSYMALVITLSVFVSKIIDYQFGFFASRAYPIEEDLTQFYGITMSTFNMVALLVQVVLTTRIVGKLGIGYSLLIMPIFLIINAGVVLVVPMLATAAALKLVDIGLKQSINKAAIELTMMPTPEDVKLKTKTFLDVFVDSLATGISGVVLIMVLQVFDLPNWIVTVIIISSLILWLYVTNKMRIEYKKVFRQSLKIEDATQAAGETIIHTYRNILQSGSEFQIVKTLNQIKDSTLRDLDHDIYTLLSHPIDTIVIASLNCLLYSDTDYSKSIIPLLDHKNQNVSILAFEYIINHQKSIPPDFLLNRLNSSERGTQIIALAAFAKEFANDQRMLGLLRIEDRLSTILANIDASSDTRLIIGCLKTIGYARLSNHFSFIDSYLNDKNPELVKNATLAAGETRSRVYLLKLSDIINNESVPKEIYIAMAKYGNRRLNTLIEKARKAQQHQWLKHICCVLELIPSTASIQSLQSLIDEEDLQIRSQAIKSLRILTDKYPLLPIDKVLLNKMLVTETKYTSKILKALTSQVNTQNPTDEKSKSLIKVLKRKIDLNLKTIFEILHIIYPPENYMQLYGYVLGENDKLRNNALEYLDNTITNDIRNYIIPLLEYSAMLDFPKDADEIPVAEMKAFLLTNQDLEISHAAQLYFTD